MADNPIEEWEKALKMIPLNSPRWIVVGYKPKMVSEPMERGQAIKQLELMEKNHPELIWRNEQEWQEPAIARRLK